MNEKKQLQPIIIFASIIALLAGLLMGYINQPQIIAAPTIQGTVLPTAKPLTAFSLTTHRNTPFNEQNFLGKWSLVFIGYTHCPDVCPTTLTTVQQAIEQMHQQNIAAPSVIFISIDPTRDNTDTLAKYVNYFDADFTGLTGSESDLKNISQQLAAYYQKTAGKSGDVTKDDYLMDHSAALMLINPDAALQAYFSAPHTAEGIVKSLMDTRHYVEAREQKN